ncbi:MAG: hypothetical protein C4525_03835 [Desulfarculus sp.]|nr:MAG: hypothetical protein C4525_03835 [Desulfarculus sp.]
MLETIKNLLLASIGAVVLTKEKALEFFDQSVAQGKLSREDAENLAQEMVEESKRQARAWGERAGQAMDNAAAALNLAQRADLEALERRVAKLELELDALARRLGPEKQDG